MIDDLSKLKAAASERRASRTPQEYPRVPDTSAVDLPARDTAILNILRACQTTLDTGQHLIEGECPGVPQSIVDRAHAPVWALIPAASAARRKTPKARIPTLERRSHQTVHANYATSIDGQRYRVSKKQKSRDYRPDDEFSSNLMIYKSFLKARKTVHPRPSITHQYAISQNTI